MQIYHYEAFSTTPGKGNPAGVVLDASGLDDDAMQLIARQVGFNESVFVLGADGARVRLRYFTPGHEVPVCGHATVAACYALYERGRLDCGPAGQDLPRELVVETGAGPLPVTLERDESGALRVWMSQLPASFVPFQGDRAALAAAIGLVEADLAADLPIVYGSTGLWTLVVPVRGLDAMRRMRPHTAAFPAVLGQMPRASIHPVCLETVDPAAHVHARHFSSPYSGTVEDPVTGTASGVLAAYLVRYGAGQAVVRQRSTPGQGLEQGHEQQAYYHYVEQGLEIGRDGRVYAEVTPHAGELHVRIAGTAVFGGALLVALA